MRYPVGLNSKNQTTAATIRRMSEKITLSMAFCFHLWMTFLLVKSRFIILIISRILPFHNRQIRGDAERIVSRNDLYLITLINRKMPGEVDRNSIADLN